jgi:hypothetical protein
LSTRKTPRERERERERVGEKNKQTKKGKQIQKNAEKFRKKYIYEKQKTRRGERKPTGGREREGKGRASIKRSCNTTRARVPRQQRPATTTVTPPPPRKAQKQKTKKKKAFSVLQCLSPKTGIDSTVGAPLAFFFY